MPPTDILPPQVYPGHCDACDRHYDSHTEASTIPTAPGCGLATIGWVLLGFAFFVNSVAGIAFWWSLAT